MAQDRRAATTSPLQWIESSPAESSGKDGAGGSIERPFPEEKALSKQRILIVEDDAALAELIREYLETMGFDAAIEARGDTAPKRILAEKPDLVILDVMLPGLDGLKVCRQVRDQFSGSILMLTALHDEVDEVVGLEVGADDYMSKPVRPRLLMAHINALLRRRVTALAVPQTLLQCGSLSLNPATRQAWCNKSPLDLTCAEFELLALLLERAGEIVSRDEIYEDLRGMEYDGIDRSIDLRIARLRRKIGDDAKNPSVIKSIRGVGYLLAGKNV